MLAIISHASETPFQWHFAGRPIIARLWCLAPLKKQNKQKNNLSEFGPL